MQGDVRQTQESSIFAQPSPGANALITYPDGSTQTAAGDGSFDAAASSYAQNHPEDLTSADAVVTVTIPAGNVPSFDSQIWTPSSAEEAQVWSGIVAGSTQPASRAVRQSARFDASVTCPSLGSTVGSGSSSSTLQLETVSKSKPTDVSWYQTFSNSTDAANGANAGLIACGAQSTPIGNINPSGVLATGCLSSVCTETTTNVNGVVTYSRVLRFRVKYQVTGTFSGPSWQYDELLAVPRNGGAGWQQFPVVLIQVCDTGRVC